MSDFYLEKEIEHLKHQLEQVKHERDGYKADFERRNIEANGKDCELLLLRSQNTKLLEERNTLRFELELVRKLFMDAKSLSNRFEWGIF